LGRRNIIDHRNHLPDYVTEPSFLLALPLLVCTDKV